MSGAFNTFCIYVAISAAHSSNQATLSKFHFISSIAFLSLCSTVLVWSRLGLKFCPPAVCIYSRRVVTPKASVLIKLLPELHDLCESPLKQSSAGGVRSARLLLRHCAVKLPLLHFLCSSPSNPLSFSHRRLIIFPPVSAVNVARFLLSNVFCPH